MAATETTPATRLVLEVAHELGTHRGAWDALMAGAPLPSPFARSWWLEAVSAAEAGSTGARFVLVWRGADLVGGVALHVDRRRLVPRYRFLGQGALTPDHLDLLARPGEEEAVAAAFAAWFARRGSRLLDVEGLAPDALLRTAVPGSVTPVDAAPYVVLPRGSAPGRDAFLATLSPSFRRNVRRTQRRLADDGVVHRVVPREEARDALDRFWALHRARGDRERLLEHAASLDRAVLAGVERAECRLDVLETDTETLAVSVAFLVGGRLSLYQVARSVRPEHASLGTGLISQLVLDAADAHLAEVDLLRGEEGYKDHFASGRRPLVRLRAAHGLPARLAARLELAARRIVRCWRRRG